MCMCTHWFCAKCRLDKCGEGERGSSRVPISRFICHPAAHLRTPLIIKHCSHASVCPNFAAHFAYHCGQLNRLCTPYVSAYYFVCASHWIHVHIEEHAQRAPTSKSFLSTFSLCPLLFLCSAACASSIQGHELQGVCAKPRL